MKEDFINAIHSQQKVSLTFYSKEDGRQLTRACAPMDFGPSRRAHDKSDRYHFWDYESDAKNHALSLLPQQVISIKISSKTFDPGEFVTWDTSKSKWFIERNWGRYS